LIGFAGFSTYSLANYTFNDTESKLRTLVSDTSDFCGEKVFNFTINNTKTSIIKTINTGLIILSPPADTTDFGVIQAEVVAVMKDYPTIKSLPIKFKAKILSLTVPKVQNQAVIQSATPLTI
jgi:hypothetical protein